MRCAAACSSHDPVMSSSETIRCRLCGDVIGVYEPMILLLDDEAGASSGAAANRRIPANARRLHAACFALLNRRPEPTLRARLPESAVLDDA
jgi:hypothetical protein